MSDNGSTVTKSRGAEGSIILILWHYTYLITMIWLIRDSGDEYFLYNIIISGNDTSRISLVLKVEIISTPVVVVGSR